ncbi:recQ-mediated genome instability protein 1-like [Ptychodera flava]|uniref:recQ-mediated genome instability protein 1-like n=1 Tax=Ptychodera flava TaxID=63121 RepID=UPI00396A353C
MVVTASGVLSNLKSSCHILAKEEWCHACIEWIQDEYQNTSLSPSRIQEIVYEQWLHGDLKELAEPSLPRGLSTQEKTILRGMYCLQVESVRDVSQPAYSQLQKLSGGTDPEELASTFTQTTPRWQTNSSRMLMLQLTDGVQALQGMEYKPCPDLSVDMSPGMKIQVQGTIQCRLGVLLLTSENVRILGGDVESLMEENSQVMVLSRAINVDPPVQMQTSNSTIPDITTEEQQPIRQQDVGASHQTLTRGQRSMETAQGLAWQQQRQVSHVQPQSLTNQWSGGESQYDSQGFKQPYPVTQSWGRQQRNDREPSHDRNTDTGAGELMDIDDDDDDLFNDDVLQHLDEIEQQFQGHAADTTSSQSPTVVAENFTLRQGSQLKPQQQRRPQQLIQGSRNSTVTAQNAGRGVGNTSTMPSNGRQFLQSSNSSNRDSVAGTSVWNQPSTSYGSGGKEVPVANRQFGGNRLPTKSFSSPVSGTDRQSVSYSGLEAEQDRKMITSTRTKTFEEEKTSFHGNAGDLESDDIDLFDDFEDDFTEAELELLSTDTLEKDPSPALSNLSDIGNFLPVREKTVVKIKGFIMTLTSTLTCHPSWSLQAKINDGTGSLEVRLSDSVLTKLIGYTVQEMKKLRAEAKTNKAMDSKLRNAIQQCKQSLIDLYGIMEVELSPQDDLPEVISISDVPSQQR